MIGENIPVIRVEGKTLPEAWENSLLELWEKGIDIKTEYDKPDDPPSKDCTMIIVVNEPLSEPRIHRAFPAGLDNLEIYRLEVVEGIHDDWINPQEGKWTYTYHQRFFNFEIDKESVNQIAHIINKLSETPYSRRCQAITWNPGLDPQTDDPPCLQRIWFRIVQNNKGNLCINMNSHWRSRDAFKAAFMNMFALIDLQKTIAEKVSEKINREVTVGRYVDISDSYHIYGSYYEDFKGFLETVKIRTFEQRTWRTDDPIIQASFQEGRQKIEMEKKTGLKGVSRFRDD